MHVLFELKKQTRKFTKKILTKKKAKTKSNLKIIIYRKQNYTI